MLQPNDRLDSLTIQSDEIEVLTPGCTMGWVANKRIRLITLSSTDRETIDAWYQRWEQIRNNWTPPDGPIYIVASITTAVEELTPYARRRSVEIGQIRPEIPTYCAVVLPQSLIGQIVKLFIWSVSSFSPKLKVQVFFDSESGLQWVLSQIDKNAVADHVS